DLDHGEAVLGARSAQAQLKRHESAIWCSVVTHGNPPTSRRYPTFVVSIGCDTSGTEGQIVMPRPGDGDRKTGRSLRSSEELASACIEPTVPSRMGDRGHSNVGRYRPEGDPDWRECTMPGSSEKPIFP